MRKSKIFWSLKGLTLPEILVVIMILSIVISFAVLNYGRLDKTQEELAKANLRLIFTQERAMYLWDEEGDPNYIEADNTTEVNTNLGLQITDSFYSYSIAATDTTFTASAAKNDGSKTFTIDQTGTISEE